MCFDAENECIRKKIQKCHLKDFFDQKHKKESIFWDFFLDVILKNTLKVNLLDVFYK